MDQLVEHHVPVGLALEVGEVLEGMEIRREAVKIPGHHDLAVVRQANDAPFPKGILLLQGDHVLK